MLVPCRLFLQWQKLYSDSPPMKKKLTDLARTLQLFVLFQTKLCTLTVPSNVLYTDKFLMETNTLLFTFHLQYIVKVSKHNLKKRKENLLLLSWAKISHQWVKMIELLVELFNKFDSNTIHYLLVI